MTVTLAVQALWRMAIREAVASHHEKIEPEHIFEAATRGGDLGDAEALEQLRKRGIDVETLSAELRAGPAALEAAGASPVKLRRAVRKRLGEGGFDWGAQEAGVVHRSDGTKRMFDEAEKMAVTLGESAVSARSLFAALLAEDTSIICAVIRESGSNLAEIRDNLAQLGMGGRVAQVEKDGGSDAGKSESLLGRFGRDLTAEARAGKLPQVIGRRKEILQMIQTLARSTKNNPLLVGEPGVGKTAIVEALAQRIAQGKEEAIKGKRLIELNVGTLVAGTKYRGEFEERVKRLLEEVKAAPDVIVFIDEIHMLIGAGDRKGGMDAANLLKPALARGELVCIGATTLAEYRAYIEKDPALERRFEKVDVPEPSRDETIMILKGLRERFERHHGVAISECALKAAVDLAIRFDAEHRLPDKAIDLIDRACVQLYLPELSARHDRPVAGGGEVSRKDVVAVLSEKTGIPVELIASDMQGTANAKLDGLKEKLSERVIGQNEAIQQVCDRLMLSRFGLTERRGPVGVFFFMGPSGVGKTELARALAFELFGSEKAMIRLDMSEYMEQHSVARLIGSPPGYVGHDEEGQLTGNLRARPYAIVLVDEIEKAHPRVADLFLQIFDDGRVTDANGRIVDAKNAIFIMTSNLGGGGQPAVKRKPLGFNRGGSSCDVVVNPVRVDEELKKFFRLEMINRFDEVIVFKLLSQQTAALIVEKRLKNLEKALQDKYGITLVYDQAVLGVLCKEGFNAEFGARELNRVIQRRIDMPLSGLLAAWTEGDARCVRCVVEEAGVEIRFE